MSKEGQAHTLVPWDSLIVPTRGKLSQGSRNGQCRENVLVIVGLEQLLVRVVGVKREKRAWDHPQWGCLKRAKAWADLTCTRMHLNHCIATLHTLHAHHIVPLHIPIQQNSNYISNNQQVVSINSYIYYQVTFKTLEMISKLTTS